MSLKAGSSYSFGLKARKFHRLKSPYQSNCTDTYPKGMEPFQNESEQSTYSRQNCLTKCYDLFGAIKPCNCSFPYYMEGKKVFKYVSFSVLCLFPCSISPNISGKAIEGWQVGSRPFCTTSDSFTCVIDFISKQKAKLLEVCNETCRPECDKTKYSVNNQCISNWN